MIRSTASGDPPGLSAADREGAMRDDAGYELSYHLVTARDAHLLDRVDPDVFDHAVRPDYLAEFLAVPSNRLVVAMTEGKVVGMASGFVYGHPDKPLQLFVNEVGVASSHRRRGIAARLVSEMLAEGTRAGCREAWVATEVANDAARRLYRSLGGAEDADRAVIYTWPLEPKP
jgi:aminoglycoside 6'-N-acetyltransferase I